MAISRPYEIKPIDDSCKPELICHISEELMKIIKQVDIKWSPIYLRRCLDERYKKPTNLINARARKRHPGVPQDNSRTVEELEASLNKVQRSGWGKEYVVRGGLNVNKHVPDWLIFQSPFWAKAVAVDLYKST